MDTTKKFCSIIRQRSLEHKSAIESLSKINLTGQMISILRQELDSMVRVIFLLNQSMTTREDLMDMTLRNEKWKIGKYQITDRDMVNISDKLNGWTESVYKFGCSFIHLSAYHDYQNNDPFLRLSPSEVNSIKNHLNNYHDFSLSKDLTLSNFEPYITRVFDKIQGNLECYVEDLEKGHTFIL